MNRVQFASVCVGPNAAQCSTMCITVSCILMQTYLYYIIYIYIHTDVCLFFFFSSVKANFGPQTALSLLILFCKGQTQINRELLGWGMGSGLSLTGNIEIFM